MSKQTGFLQLRRGLWDHLRDGRMTPFETLAFIYICSQADTRTGVWKGSAGAIVGELGFEPRTARDVLERLERDGYIRRFTVPGSHICYPILIHKFLPTTGEHNGEQLDALSSTFVNGCLKLAFFPREEHGEVNGKDNGEDNASQMRSKKREQKKETHKRGDAAKAAAAPPPCEFESYLKTLPAEIQKHALSLKSILITQFNELGRLPNLLSQKDSFVDSLDAEALLSYRDICYLFRNVVRWVRWLVTPTPRVIDNPVGPVDAARLAELVAADPDCTEGYMAADGIAVMVFQDGIEMIVPGQTEPCWHSYEIEEKPTLEHAMPAVSDSTEPSARIGCSAHQ